jgi:hypothetical protein
MVNEQAFSPCVVARSALPLFSAHPPTSRNEEPSFQLRRCIEQASWIPLQANPFFEQTRPPLADLEYCYELRDGFEPCDGR